MSRAEYLTKYLSGNDKKKKKKSHQPSAASIVVVGGARDIPTVEHANDEILNASADPENEYLPAKVDPVSSKPLRGFRRIDDGEERKAVPAIPQADLQQQQTVYRDQSGRIVDLEARRRQLQEEKEQKLAEEAALKDRINTGEADMLEREEKREAESRAVRFDVSKNDQEYVTHMNLKSRFEDPMALFNLSPDVETKSKTGRPIYTGGMHPENRFGIKAGHFWDGIDRTNGFEERLLEKRTQQQVQKVTKKATLESYTDYDYE